MSKLRTGQFVWRELMTPDPAAAAAFYQALLGWGSQAMEMPGIGTYTMHTLASGAPQGGYVAMGPEGGHPPHWMPYVSVDDLEATIVRARNAGGTVAVGPMAAGDAGRFAVLADPQGAYVTAWTSAGGDDGPAPDFKQPGAFCWEQLNTSDVRAAAAFYGETFGWSVSEFHGMTVFSAGDVQVAHAMEAPAGAPPHWLCHVVVADLAAARAQVRELGGSVMIDEIAIPTVGVIAVVVDPQGATLCLFQPENPAS